MCRNVDEMEGGCFSRLRSVGTDRTRLKLSTSDLLTCSKLSTSDLLTCSSDICSSARPISAHLLVWSTRLICSSAVFFVLLEKGGAYFSTILLFSLPLSNSTSFFTFIHAHKCTPKTLFINSNKDRRHEHVLIRSRTSFTKACDSAECFGGRESIASFRQSSFGEKRSH